MKVIKDAGITIPRIPRPKLETTNPYLSNYDKHTKQAELAFIQRLRKTAYKSRIDTAFKNIFGENG